MKITKYTKYYAYKMKNDSFFSRLLKNLVISFIGEGGSAVVTFLTTIALIILIGNSNYGILTVAYSFVLIVDGFVNFQSWHAVITFGSKYLQKKDYISLEKLLKICTLIDFTTAILGSIVAVLTINLFSNLFSWDEITNVCVYYLSFTILFNFTGTSVGYLRLTDKFKLFSEFRILAESLRLIFVLIFCFILKQGVVGAALGYTIGYVLGDLWLISKFISEIRKDVNISLRRMFTCKIKGKWQSIFKFTFWTCMSSSADIPVQQFDTIFLSMISYEIVAVFKVYKQISQVLTKLTTPLKQSVMPLFSELLAKGKGREAYGYLINLRNKSMKILVPFVIIITIMSLCFMSVVFDSIYVTNWYILLSYLLLRALALSYAAIHPLFISMGQVKKNFLFTLVANIVYCIIVAIFISKIGIWAILLGLGFEYVILIFLKKNYIEKILFN